MVYLPEIKFYKGTGALQMKLNPFNSETGVKGNLMLEMCPSNGKDPKTGRPTYSWANDKIIMKMTEVDLSQLLLMLRSSTELDAIVHDPQAGTDQAKQQTKRLMVSPGQREGTKFIRMAFGEKKAQMPMDQRDMTLLLIMIPRAIHAIFGWPIATGK